MPELRAGQWVYKQEEVRPFEKEVDTKAENKAGHRSLASYQLPKWVYHPETPSPDIVIKRQDYFGMAADGVGNFAQWNIAHVAAYHDDLKMLSMATREECKEKNKFGMTPTHMCGLGQHPYGPSLAVLYQLVQLGVADPRAMNHADQTPWHICQRMHKADNVKTFEKVLMKGFKPDIYTKLKETQLKFRGKFARPKHLRDAPVALEDSVQPLPVCLIFPGQGSQYIGMLNDAKDLPAVKELLDKAKPILGYDILDIALKGPEDKLAETRYCQPAMYIAGLAAVERLRLDDPEQISRCMAVSGLSLGEYTALTVAGVFDFETGLKLVKARGEAMDLEATRPGGHKQTMLSVAGLEQEKVKSLCAEVLSTRPGEVAQISNFLFPKGFTVGGTDGALRELETKAMDAGALQAKLLKTSGAFHTPMMAGAKERLMTVLTDALPSMQPPRCKVYVNSTGKSIGPETPTKDIIALLGEQLVSPVLWNQCMTQALEDGCTQFFELGPSKQLKAMMKRINQRAADRTTNVTV